LIPYFEIPALEVFGLEIHSFGVLVMMGFLIGSKLASNRALEMGLKPVVIYDISILFVIFGFIGAHLVHVLAYEPHIISENPWRLLEFWSGISSFGGFLGGGLAAWIYLKRKDLSFLRYGDALAFGFLPGWMFGRLGCFSAHDHIGSLSSFILAVQFPGGARHDLGLYEAIVSFFISLVLFGYFRRRSYPPGWVFSVVLMIYAPIRFLLEFLRATDISRADARYASLTPAQYGAMALFLLGVFHISRLKRHSS